MVKDVPAEAREVAKFEEIDAMARSLLMSFISDEYLECIQVKTLVNKMWNVLENTFAKKSSGRQKVIRNQTGRLKFKDKLTFNNLRIFFGCSK